MFIFRPKAGHGFWLPFLVPLAYFINTVTRENVHFEYKLNTIVSITLLLQSIEIFIKFGSGRLPRKINFTTKLVPGLIGTILVRICLNQRKYVI